MMKDQCLLLVSRICSSPTFAKSPKLVSFLEYVSKQKLAGLSEQINEQVIGVEVFGRSSGYDSNDDNIVRAHASRLRQKLDLYFQNEGREETIRVVMPKGSYVPSFEDNPAISPVGRSPAPEVALTQSGLPSAPNLDGTSSSTVLPDSGRFWNSQPRYWAFLFVACLLVSAATYFLTKKLDSTFQSAEPNHALWQELLAGSSQPTFVVPGDSSLVLYQNLSGHGMTLADYLNGAYRNDLESKALIDGHVLRKIARRRLTSIVDLELARRITQRPEASRAGVQLRYARDLHVEDVRHGNAILIGADEANPWLQLFSANLNFNIVPDQNTGIFTITNRSPKGNEASQYRMLPGDPEHRAYAVAALVPNLDGNGHVLIIQGTAMAGTEAAGDYLLSHAELAKLLTGSTHDRVPNFEVLLETSNLNGNAPQAKIIALRINGH